MDDDSLHELMTTIRERADRSSAMLQGDDEWHARIPTKTLEAWARRLSALRERLLIETEVVEVANLNALRSIAGGQPE